MSVANYIVIPAHGTLCSSYCWLQIGLAPYSLITKCNQETDESAHALEHLESGCGTKSSKIRCIVCKCVSGITERD